MALIKIFGDQRFFDCTSIEIKKVSAGRWEVTYDHKDYAGNETGLGRTFTVVGGKHSGGASNEWFCHHPEFFGDAWVPVKSMVAAVRLGVQH